MRTISCSCEPSKSIERYVRCMKAITENSRLSIRTAIRSCTEHIHIDVIHMTGLKYCTSTVHQSSQQEESGAVFS